MEPSWGPPGVLRRPLWAPRHWGRRLNCRTSDFRHLLGALRGPWGPPRGNHFGTIFGRNVVLETRARFFNIFYQNSNKKLNFLRKENYQKLGFQSRVSSFLRFGSLPSLCLSFTYAAPPRTSKYLHFGPFWGPKMGLKRVSKIDAKKHPNTEPKSGRDSPGGRCRQEGLYYSLMNPFD